jgi:hypothetical protein
MKMGSRLIRLAKKGIRRGVSALWERMLRLGDLPMGPAGPDGGEKKTKARRGPTEPKR